MSPVAETRLIFFLTALLICLQGEASRLHALPLPIQKAAAEEEEPLPEEKEDSRENHSYEMTFQGNSQFSAWRLKRFISDELHDFETYGYRKTDIDDAAFAIETEYRKAGFPFVAVDYSFTQQGEELQIVFRVEEGTPTEVEEILLEGAKSFSREDLISFFSLPASGILGTGKPLFVRDAIDSGASAIERFYYGEGFLEVQVDPPQFLFSEDKALVRVTIPLHEGIRHTIHDVRIECAPSFREAILEIAGLFKGAPYTPSRDKGLQLRIEELLMNQGHLHPKVAVHSEPGPQPGWNDLEVEVDAGPIYSVQGFRIEGNEKTSTTFIRNRLAIQQGETYSSGKVREAHFNLFKTGIFKSILIQHEPAGEQEVRLVITVKERESLEITPFVGFGSYEQLRLGVSVMKNNLFGTGRKFKSSAKVSFKGEEIQASLLDPWFLETSLQGTLSLSYLRREERSFSWRERGIKPSISREILPHLDASLSYGFAASRTYAVEADVDQSLIDSVQISSFTLRSLYDRRNRILNPTEGYYAEIQLEWAGSALGSEVSFLRGEGAIGMYLTPFSDITVALSARTGVIRPFGETGAIPLQRRFFSGGDTTVRSFKEAELGPKDKFGDPIGGEAYTTFNSEIRFPLFDRLQGAIFHDSGNLLKDAADYGLGDMRGAVGFGFRYMLPIGPIRLDWGFNPNPREDEDSWNVFFSVGYPF